MFVIFLMILLLYCIPLVYEINTSIYIYIYINNGSRWHFDILPQGPHKKLNMDTYNYYTS